MVSTTVGWLLAAIQSLAGMVFGSLGVGGLVAVIFGAVLLCSLAANAMKLISQPKGMAFSGAALLVGLGLVWVVPPTPKAVVQKIVQVVHEIPPPVVGTIQSQIAGLEEEAQRQRGELAAQVEAARREAEGRAKAEDRLRVVEKQLASARPPAAKPKPQAKKLAANGECRQCGHQMRVGRGLAGENIRCGNCGMVMSARSAWTRFTYTQSVQDGRIKPNRPASPMYADFTYHPMFE